MRDPIMAMDAMVASHNQSVLAASSVALEEHSDNNPFNQIVTYADAMNVATEGVKPDLKMCRAVSKYTLSIISRGENLDFFGGNLLGVNRIRFFDKDRDRWFDEVLGVDETYAKECISKIKILDSNWKVSTDAFNVTVVWFVHKVISNVGLRDKTAANACIDALILLQFRFITSLYSEWFSKPVDVAAAEATYSALTLKFAIKQLGSWGAVFRQRAESFLDPNGIHYLDFVEFSNDDGVKYILSDMSTRLRKSIKDMYAELENVRANNNRMNTQSNVVTVNGDSIIRDRVSVYNNAKDFILDSIGNETSFIKSDLVNVVLDVMTTTSKISLMETLKVLSATPQHKRAQVDSFVEDTLLFTFDYIVSERIRFNDASLILVKMRGIFTAPKSKDPRLLSLRDRIGKYIAKNTSIRSSSTIASVRTSVMLYFVLRAISVSTYQ